MPILSVSVIDGFSWQMPVQPATLSAFLGVLSRSMVVFLVGGRGLQRIQTETDLGFLLGPTVYAAFNDVR